MEASPSLWKARRVLDIIGAGEGANLGPDEVPKSSLNVVAEALSLVHRHEAVQSLALQIILIEYIFNIYLS